jgi:hypothetical protein
MWHRIRHWFHLNTGIVVSEWRGREIWIGFKCSACGRVYGWHKSAVGQSREAR